MSNSIISLLKKTVNIVSLVVVFILLSSMAGVNTGDREVKDNDADNRAKKIIKSKHGVWPFRVMRNGDDIWASSGRDIDESNEKDVLSKHSIKILDEKGEVVKVIPINTTRKEMKGDNKTAYERSKVYNSEYCKCVGVVTKTMVLEYDQSNAIDYRNIKVTIIGKDGGSLMVMSVDQGKDAVKNNFMDRMYIFDNCRYFVLAWGEGVGLWEEGMYKMTNIRLEFYNADKELLSIIKVPINEANTSTLAYPVRNDSISVRIPLTGKVYSVMGNEIRKY